MNISTDTVAILKNFSEINDNILFKPGNKLNTISAMKNILAEATVSEKFESEFGIYSLSELLRAVDLFDKPNLKINGTNHMTIKNLNKQLNISLLINQCWLRLQKRSICQTKRLLLL